MQKRNPCKNGVEKTMQACQKNKSETGAKIHRQSVENRSTNQQTHEQHLKNDMKIK